MLIFDYCCEQLDLIHLNTDKQNYDAEILAVKSQLTEKNEQLNITGNAKYPDTMIVFSRIN